VWPWSFKSLDRWSGPPTSVITEIRFVSHVLSGAGVSPWKANALLDANSEGLIE
jgi:hypothetical protein